ncbi:hypothetical protein [Rhizobium sp. AN80A]|uniref:hypothetical protein n=1 Tax=Rhizobium sp. AN80A TaxID=3040673 RepID=UPI0024B3BF5A|nr:hypothetical protein [Rhizobium sp. AN80A]
MTEIPKTIDEAWGAFNSRAFNHGKDETAYNSFRAALSCLFDETPPPVDREAVFHGPYTVTFMGPAVWAGIKDELPGHLVDKQVWVTATPPGGRAEPDYCYDPKEWEFTSSWDERDQVHGHGDGLTRSEPMEVATLIRGPRKWVADVPVTWDDAGDPDETEIKWFDSEADAIAAIAAKPEAIGDGR